MMMMNIHYNVPATKSTQVRVNESKIIHVISDSDWETKFAIALSTILPVMAIGVGCYVSIICVRKTRSRSKRQTATTQRQNPTPTGEGILILV